MKLTFQSEHLSISRLDPTEIGDFTVLTGVNGSGKSHLLEAIFQRKIIIDGQADLRIVRFNFENFKLENEGAYYAHQFAGERDAAWQRFMAHALPTLRAQRQSLGEHYTAIADQVLSSGKSFFEGASDGYRQAVKSLFKANTQQHDIGIFQLIQTLPYGLDQITKEDFYDRYKPFAQVGDFLPHAIGRVVWDYYVKFRDNQLNRFLNSTEGKNYSVKTDAEFIAAHGERPWVLMNTILKQFDTLDYEIGTPEGSSTHNSFQLRLIHTKKKGLQIDFNALSSGERVLMALVASIYKASSDKFFPDVLLLDELDASLHPSMIKNMLAVIQEIFLSRGIKVILVTHSPTTIALAPDEAVYVMRKEGPKRIEKTPKKEALSILTEGFATLDEGLIFFDEVAKHPVSVITEGHNARYVNKAIELFGIPGVKVIGGLEAVTGKGQLRTLYDFFSRVQHKHKVLFVWDCDASSFATLPETQNTYRFVLARNAANTLISSGIENAFDPALFDGFRKKFINSRGVETEHFDETRKSDFAEFVINRNTASDFAQFTVLRDKLVQLVAEAKSQNH